MKTRRVIRLFIPPVEYSFVVTKIFWQIPERREPELILSMNAALAKA